MALRWLRSWPEVIPAHRAHVMDDMERVAIEDYDYAALRSYNDAPLCLLEWDMAVGLGDRQRFESACRREPDVVRVAPYPLYRPGDAAPYWAHRRLFADGSERPIYTSEPVCDLFAFGMLYLPPGLVRAFLAERPGRRFTDHTFSLWHHRTFRGGVPVEWTVRPVHLHYPQT